MKKQCFGELINKQNVVNKVLLEEYDAITLLLYMDTINNILEEIQDTILRTKISLPNTKLLTLKEILMVESLLNEQGVSTQFPEQALNYVEPKIAMKRDILLYILRIPELEKETSEIIKILPLTVDQTVIIDPPTYVVKSGKNLFTTSKPLSFVQKNAMLKTFKDTCIYPIMFGKASHCNVKNDENTFIGLVSDNKILLNNVNHIPINSNCGPDNRTLSGNFLITFQNCSIKTGNKTFEAKEIISNLTNEVQGAFTNLIILRNTTGYHDIRIINNRTLLNRKQLEHINLKQYDHGVIIWSIFGGLSITSVTVASIVIYICLRSRKVVIKDRCPKPGKLSYTTSQENTLKDEDVLSSPPGGITCEHSVTDMHT